MKKLYLSDVDGTLVKGSLMLNHAGFLLENKIIEDNGIYDAWIKDVKNESLIAHLAEHYRFEIINKKEEDLYIPDFMYLFFNRNDNFYSTIELLKEAKEMGNEVCLISGSPDYLVGYLASMYDFNFGASKYYKNKENLFTGKVKGLYSYTQKKNFVKKTFENINDYEQVISIGDTCSDGGLFIYGDYNILVDPSKETKENIKEPIHQLIFN